MKHMHIHISVDNLDKSIEFYSTLFAQKPTKQKDDYAKWQLDDPRVNFAISNRGTKTGLDHLGIQVDEENELKELRNNLKEADMKTFNEGEADCCYAKSDKTWVEDPSGIAWESYRTMGEVEFFNGDNINAGSCCVPKTEEQEVKNGCC